MLASKLLILIGVSLQAWDSMAIIFRQYPLEKPAYCAQEEGCFSPITKKVLPFGVDIYPNGICKKLTCEANGYTAVHSCEETVVPRGCKLSSNPKLQYPLCCAKVICPPSRYYDTYDKNEGQYVEVLPQREKRYDDQYVEILPQREKRYAVVDDKPIIYNDGRGDDYKLKEDNKVLYNKKKESSRRAPWNKNKDIGSQHIVPEYSVENHKGDRITVYKPDNSGDDYKLDQDTKILYNNKDEASRRAPWNKNGDVSSHYVSPAIDDKEGGYVKYYKPDKRGDDYKLKEDNKVLYNKKKESSRRAPWNKNKDIGSQHIVPQYSVENRKGDRITVYKPDNSGDDYKLDQDTKILYNNKDEASRRAPWNKNGDVSSHYVSPAIDDKKGGYVKYYKPDKRGDDYKLKEDNKVLYNKKKESSRRAPWNKNKDIGSQHIVPQYSVENRKGDRITVYKPDNSGDDYKLDQDTKILYNNKDEASRRAPWNKNGDVSSHYVSPAVDDKEGGYIKYYKPDKHGDDYKLKEDNKILYNKKKESSRRAPWNKNEDIGSQHIVPQYSVENRKGDRITVYKPDNNGDDYKLDQDTKILYNNKDESSRRAPWNKNGDVSSHYVSPAVDDKEGGYVKYYKPDKGGDDYKVKEDNKVLYNKKKESSRRAPWNKNKDIGSHYVVPEYSIEDNKGGRITVYKSDNRGDDYKLDQDTKILYNNKDEASRRAPWNKNGDVSSQYVSPAVDDKEGGHDKYYKPDSRGDDYKLIEDNKVWYNKKKESSKRAPWNKNKNLNYGATGVTPEYYTHDKDGKTITYYKPEYRGDDYKLEEDKKVFYNDKDESSRRAPSNDSDGKDEFNSDPEIYQDNVDVDDGRGDNYKLHEEQGVQGYERKKVTSRRAPWNENPTV